MKLEKLGQKIAGNSRQSLQERVFRLITNIGIVGLVLGGVTGFFAGESLTNQLSILVAVVIFAIIVIITLRTHKIQRGAIIISALAMFLVLPFNFLTAGGVFGGGPIWFVLGFVLVTLTVEGKAKYILLAGGYIMFLICYYIAYFYPQRITQHNLEMTYVDSAITLTIVSFVTCGMLLFQTGSYKTENEMVREQNKKIEELNKAQNRFFSSMSHEIRTPINTIIGLNEMILREEVSDEVVEDARNIQNASKILLALINDILDMSKMESGKMDIVTEVYDVGDSLSDIVNMIWVRAKEKGLSFHIDVAEDIPSKLYGDEVRIKQILINLLNNAVKYTPKGSITLSIQCRKKEGDIVHVVYSVTDTGMGIKKESIPHLFDAFQRVDVKENHYIEGTGLGLSIVKQLVELMGGEIGVDSVYRKGSSFVVTLPQRVAEEKKLGELDFEKKRTLNAHEHYKASFEAPKAHVLIVDDNETNLLVAEKLLQATRVNVDKAKSGAECIRLALQHRYDVIFMDHLMPEMDGIECLHQLRSQVGGLNMETPVVILTANAGGENQALYKREGFDGYLLKPVSGAQLEEELLKHLPREMVSLANAQEFKDMVVGPVLGHKRKLPVMITTDSVSDIPVELAKKYRIEVMPYRVLTEGGEFKDGEEIETEGVLTYIGENGKNVRSEAPEPEDYEMFFSEQLAGAQHIIHIAMAKNASQGYENALKASRTFDNVTVIDSGHLSSGMGLIVLYAAMHAAEGMNVEAVLKEIDNMKARTKTSFIVGDTEYLARAGRIPDKVNAICQAFMLHPVIVLKNSSMTVGAIRMGGRDAIWRKYIDSVLKNGPKIDRRMLFITHAGLNQDELDGIADRVREKISFEQVIYQKASPAISANCGPDSFGLLYMQKSEHETADEAIK